MVRGGRVLKGVARARGLKPEEAAVSSPKKIALHEKGVVSRARLLEDGKEEKK